MRIKTLILILLLLLPTTFSFPYLCCRDRSTYQYKCFKGGECCNGFWYPACRNFDVWIIGKRMTIGEPTPLPVYVRNKGAYTDTYRITLYQVSPTGNAIIDIQTNEISIPPSDVKAFTPIVILLSSQQTTITFTVTSDSGLSKQASVTLSGESMYSMSEFSSTFAILLAVLSASLCWFKFIYRKL